MSNEYRRGANDALNAVLAIMGENDYAQNILREAEISLGLYDDEDIEIEPLFQRDPGDENVEGYRVI